MESLKGQNIYLRALEPEDLEFIYRIENNQNLWQVSNTQTPYSKYLIKQYLENAQQDIYEAKQLRLTICLNNEFNAIGLIDLFDFDPKNKRAGIGIVIEKESNRNNGYGQQALKLIINFAFNDLHLHQLFANIHDKNKSSLQLFHTFGFIEIGLKKDWNFHHNSFHNEILMQLIKK